MTSRLVFLVRHGAAERQKEMLHGREPGVRLTRVGRTQAEAAAMRLREERIEAVFSSPLERTRETAEIIAAAAAVPLILAPALNEIEFGAWSGRHFAELTDDPLWARWNADRGRTRAPGGERMSETAARTADWLAELDGESRVRIAAVSHSDVIKALVAHVLGLSLHFHDRFDIDPAGVTTLCLDDAGPRLVSLNERAHASAD